MPIDITATTTTTTTSNSSSNVMMMKDVTQLERIGAHSHITGLGLNELLDVVEDTTVTDGGDTTSGDATTTTTTMNMNMNSTIPKCGFIGQHKARRAMGIVYQLLMKQNSSTNKHQSSVQQSSKPMVMGRSVLIAGPPSTGKTALAAALAVELSKQTIAIHNSSSNSNSNTSNTDGSSSSSSSSSPTIPFVNFPASTVYSVEVSKTEAMTQAIRRAIGVCIQEETEIICGEVIEIQIDTSMTTATSSSSSSGGGGLKKTGRITLCTTDMETIYDLGMKMIASLQKEKISAGDVITIDKTTGKVTKVGRSIGKSRDYDAISTTTKFVHPPNGELIQRKVTNHIVSLHEMDVINSRSQGFLALFAGDTGEIRSEIRQQIDVKVQEWKEEGRATIVPGVLFIDEIHMLDMECFTYLNRALESEIAPIFVFATNRGYSTIRGTNYKSPHGIPMDLLDRLMIVPTTPYTIPELRQILLVRANEESVTMDPAALELLTRIAHESSLRYAMHLITVSHYSAKKKQQQQRQQGTTCIQIQDIQRCFALFIDVQRSTARLLMNSSNNNSGGSSSSTTATTSGHDNNTIGQEYMYNNTIIAPTTTTKKEIQVDSDPTTYTTTNNNNNNKNDSSVQLPTTTATVETAMETTTVDDTMMEG